MSRARSPIISPSPARFFLLPPTGVGLLVALAVVTSSPRPAAAGSARLAYVDQVEVFGGPAASEGRSFVATVLRQAGLGATFAGPDETPCGEDAGCLAERAQKIGADVSLRATVALIAGQTSVGLFVVRASGSVWRYQKRDVDLGAGDPEVAAALASSPLLARDEEGGAPVAAWSLTGAGLVLVAGGAVAIWRAFDLRDQFLREHVDDGGDVVGLSPAGARAAEKRARRFALAGSLLVGAGAAAGLGAGILFVRDSGERSPRPAGLVVEGDF